MVMTNIGQTTNRTTSTKNIHPSFRLALKNMYLIWPKNRRTSVVFRVRFHCIGGARVHWLHHWFWCGPITFFHRHLTDTIFDFKTVTQNQCCTSAPPEWFRRGILIFFTLGPRGFARGSLTNNLNDHNFT